MEQKTTYQAAFALSLVAFACVLVMGFGTPIPEEGLQLQPSMATGPISDFVRATNNYPQLALRFFATDSLFVLSYLIVFVGLYMTTKPIAPALATLGLSSGIATAVLDATENSFFIIYATLSLNGVPLENPTLPLIYVLANLKWMASFATLMAFGLVWPSNTPLNILMKVLMLGTPLLGILGVLNPDLVALRGLTFLVGMPVFAIYFWQQLQKPA